MTRSGSTLQRYTARTVGTFLLTHLTAFFDSAPHTKEDENDDGDDSMMQLMNTKYSG